jgi:hypothetical protein
MPATMLHASTTMDPARHLQPSSRRRRSPSALPKPRLASSQTALPQPILRPPSLIERTAHRSGNASPWPHAIDALEVSQAVMFIDFPRAPSRRVAAGNIPSKRGCDGVRRPGEVSSMDLPGTYSTSIGHTKGFLLPSPDAEAEDARRSRTALLGVS